MPMTSPGIPVLGTYGHGIVASGTTAATILIPPYPGPPGPPFLYNAQALNSPLLGAVSATKANWLTSPQFGLTRISSILANASSTAHTVFIFRPLNWTYFPAGLAKNITAIPNGSGASSTGIFDDPGIYSTNYKYPTPGAVAPSTVADAAISSTNLNVCYQLSDGVWQFDTIASGTFNSSLTLTTGTPNRAGGAILPGAPMFYFGAIAGTLKDPATGLVAWTNGTLVSVVNTIQDVLVGEYSAMHTGDPLLVYDANGTGADSIVVQAYYGQW